MRRLSATVALEVWVVLCEHQARAGWGVRLGGGCGDQGGEAGIGLESLIHGSDDVAETLWIHHLQIAPGLGQSGDRLSLLAVASISKDLLAGHTDGSAVCTSSQLSLFASRFRRGERLGAGVLIETGWNLGSRGFVRDLV
jgi:hypothetical protein